MRLSSADARAIEDLVRRGNRPVVPSSAPVVAKGALKARVMNKTEALYAERLEGMRAAGEVVWFAFEAVTLRLADDTRYTPDFAVLTADREWEAHEVKGAWAIFRDDAKVKIKVAAAMFPIRFYVCVPRREGGWDIRVV